MILPWAYVAELAENPWVSFILSWALVLQSVRRLHDIGISGWWIAAYWVATLALAFLPASYPHVPALWWIAAGLPVAGLAAVAVWPGQRGDNRFGPPPGSGRAAADRASRNPGAASH